METLGINSQFETRQGPSPASAAAGRGTPVQPVTFWRDSVVRPAAMGAAQAGAMDLVFSLRDRADIGWRPAGDALTTGTPAASYARGAWNFRASLLALWNTPVIDRARFAAALDRTVGEMIPGAFTDGTRTTVSVGQRTTVNLSPGVLSVDRERPGAWVTITGTITCPAGMSLAQVNQAVARALGQSMTWTSMATNAGQTVPARAPFIPPPDGAQLFALLQGSGLSGGGPCGGGYKDDQVWARGCIRLVANTTASPQLPALQPIGNTPAPARPAAPAPAPTPAAPAAPAPAGSCVVAPRDYFYLRPTPTFAATGTRYAAGTPILLLAQTTMTQRGASGAELKLYRVRINSGTGAGQEGFAALSAADLQPASVGSCPTGTAIAQYAINATTGASTTTGTAPVTPAPATPARPPTAPATPARPPTAPSPVLAQLRTNTSAGSAGMWLGGAALFMAAVGGGLYWKREELGLVDAKPTSPARRSSVPATRTYA